MTNKENQCASEPLPEKITKLCVFVEPSDKGERWRDIGYEVNERKFVITSMWEDDGLTIHHAFLGGVLQQIKNEAYERAARLASAMDHTNGPGQRIAREIRKLKDQANDE